MARALVIYYSRGGTTKKMAERIVEGIEAGGVEAKLKDVKEVVVDELLEYDAIIIGSPTYYGAMSAEIKKLLDDSVKLHGKLDGRIGAAFSSSVNVAGGNETTILNILNAMLIHGMIIYGDPQGDHYGPVALGSMDSRVIKECLRLGERIAGLTKKLRG